MKHKTLLTTLLLTSLSATLGAKSNQESREDHQKKSSSHSQQREKSIEFVDFWDLIFRDDISSSKKNLFPYDLTKEELLELGYRFWHSYAEGTLEGLTTWDGSDSDHQFLYLGIAHNIWAPEGSTTPFGQDWPVMAARLKELGFHLKPWMLKENAPWGTQEEFEGDITSHKKEWLQNYLSKRKLVMAQALVLVERLQKSMDPKNPNSLLQGLTKEERALVEYNFNALTSCKNPSGLYALIDYVNFKGEGASTTEQYDAQGWGLRQVLLNMVPPAIFATEEDTLKAFVQSAEDILMRRVVNHKKVDPASHDEQYIPLWYNHLQTYLLTQKEVAAAGLDQAPRVISVATPVTTPVTTPTQEADTVTTPVTTPIVSPTQ